MSGNRNEYIEASPEERERMRERKAIAHAMVVGHVPCVCVHCCNTFVSFRNLVRHIETSKKCMQLRVEGGRAVDGMGGAVPSRAR